MPSRHRTSLPSILLVVVLVALTALPPATAVAAPTSAARSVMQSALAAPAASVAMTSPALSTALSGLPQPSVGAMGGVWQAALTQPRTSQSAAPDVVTTTRSDAAGPQQTADVPPPPSAPQPPVDPQPLAAEKPDPTPMSMSGLSFIPPASWGIAPKKSLATNVTADLADTDLVRFTSPDGAYTLDLVVDWHALAPEAAFGSFALKPLPGYRMSFASLPAGEIVQVMQLAVDPGGKGLVLAHAAFRSGQASYAVQLVGSNLTTEALEAFDALVASLDPHPDDLAASSLAMLGETDTSTSAASTGLTSNSSAAPVGTEAVAYDRTAAVLYANYWTQVEPLHNGDGCYLWSDGPNLSCEYVPGYYGVDGAHFINRALDAGGLAAPPLWDPEALRIESLRSWLLANGGLDMPDASSLVAGDVVFVGTGSCWGWGGAVVGVDGLGPLLNVHSWNAGGMTTDRAGVRYTQLLWNACGPTDSYSFVHVDAPAGPPTDTIPPVIHWVHRWQNEGRAVFRAMVTDNTAVAEVILVYNGANVPMTLVGGDEYEAVVDLPLTQISTWQVVAIDVWGNVSVFPPGTPINIRGYLSRGLGGFNFACGAIGCESPGTNATGADPVNTAHGNFFYPVSLLTVPGPGDSDIKIDLSYNSLAGEPVGTIEYTADGDGVVETPYDVHVEPFGLGWTFSLGPSLLILDNALFTGVQVRYPDGHTVDFAAQGGAYVPDDTRVYDTLTADGGGYLLKRKDLTEYRFNAEGRLTQIADRNGNTVSLSYDGANLTRAENSAGRWVTFAYNGDGQVTGIDAPEGRHLGFAYTDKLLTAITDGEGNMTQYQYDASKRLSAVITPKEHPSLRMTYDEVGRVIEQTVGEAATTSFVYDDAAHTTTMTDALSNVTAHVYDDKQRLIESRDALVASERFGYDDNDHRTSFTDREGRQWSYTYDDHGNRLTEDGPLGWHREWEYNGLDLVTHQKDSLNRETRWEYDARGNLVKIINPDLAESGIVNDSRGLPTSVTDFNRKTTTLTYDSVTGDLLFLTDPESHTMGYTYDGLGRVRTMTDFNGQVYTYTYNNNDKLTDVDGPLGYHVGYRFDANGNLDLEIDPNEGEIDYAYDESENLTDIYDQLDSRTQLTYDAMNHLASEMDPEGRVTVYDRDDVYRVIAIHAAFGTPESATTQFVYDSVDNVLKTIDPEGRVTFDAYDELNRRTASVANYIDGAPLTADTNVETRWEYDLAGNIKKLIDGNGNPTLFDYDELNRKIREENAEHEVTQFDYDPMGDLILVIDPRLNPTEYEYDGNGRRTLIHDALDQETHYLYDPNGNLTDELDPRDVVTRHEYNALNQRTATVRNYKPYMTPDSETNVRTEFVYDLAGNLKAVTDPNTNVTQYDYDATNRLIEITDAKGHLYTPYEYDKVDNRTVVRDANGNPTSYQYDALNRPISKTDAEGHGEEYTYDRVGNRLATKNGRTFVTTTQYDPLNRPVKIIAPVSGVVTTMVYDAVGTLKSVTDPEQHTETYTHDLVYRLLSQADGAGNTWTFKYDDNGNLILVVDPNGNATDYDYDELNRLITETDALDGVTRHDYDAVGNETARTAPNLVVTHFDYDPLYRLSARTDNFKFGLPPAADVNVLFSYRYDAASNLREEVDALTYPTQHTYDELNRRVRTIDAETGQTDYGYDRVGNLTSLSNPRRNPTEFEYYRDNLLKLVRDAKGSEFKFDYDEAHNLTQTTDPYGVVTRGEFDELNRLIASIRNYRAGQPADSQTNVTTGYEYYRDSLPRRMTNPRGFPTDYVYDAAHRLTDVIDAQAGRTRTEYDRMDHVLATVNANGHRTEFEFDELYRLKAATDPAGHVESYSYDPVGNVISMINARGYATTTAYDPLNRAVLITDALDGQVANVYDAMGNVLQRTDQNGHTDRYTYDRLHRLLTHTDAEGYVTSQRYDPNSNVVALVDGNTHATSFGYDELDRLSWTTNAENETTRYAYDRLGNRTDLIEADQVVTRYEYDPLYRLAAVILNYRPYMEPGVDVNVRYGYTYDENGNVVRIADPLTHVTQFVQDSLDRLDREINPLNNVWQYTYDPVGNLKTRRDANNALTNYSYYDDELLWKTEYPDGTAVTRAYDPNHNLVGLTDSLGSSSWVFDKLDRMTVATDAPGRTLSYAYDPVGNQTGITYPDSRTVAYSYYKNNWLKTVTDPLAGVTSYQRDGVGQVTLATNPNDTVAEMSYDKANRLLTLVNRQTVGAKKTISAFAYTLDDVGQRIKIDAEYGWRNPPTVSTTYTYDPLRRLTRTENNEGAWAAYTFDAAGNRKTLSTNDDELSPKPFDAKAETYSYDDANALLTVLSDTSVNGVKPSRTANVAQALAAFRHEVAAQRGKHITTTAADALLAAADDLIARLYSNKPPSQTATATAIAALRSQVQAYRAGGAIDSDGIANSLLVKLDKAANANQSKTGELQTTTYTYDDNGNRIGIAWPGPQGPQTQGTDYAYNYENLLTRALDYQAGTGGVRINRSLTTMSYDGLNRRLVKAYQPKIEESDVKRTEYAFDVLDPVAEYSMWNGQYNNYYRGDLGRMVAMQNFPSEQRYTYHYDGLGSMSALTKEQGQSVHTYRYDPYGYVYPDKGNWTDPHNGYTFTGQEYDEETSLLHFYARDYDPLRGVWMQQDPYRGRLPEPLMLHRYMYVRDNPTNYTDPTGEFWWVAAGAAVGGLIAYGAQVYANTQQGMSLGEAMTTNIDVGLIASGALLGASAVMMAPVAVGMAGQAVAGTGMLVGSAGLFSAGLNTMNTAQTMSNAIYGIQATQTAQGGVYWYTDPAAGKIVRVGRTGDLQRRALEYARNPMYSSYRYNNIPTDMYAEQRGLEQRLYDLCTPPPALNRIRPISISNPNYESYMKATEKFTIPGGQ